MDHVQRREHYLQVASRVFLEKGISAATMQDVADAAGVPRILVYRVFKTKRLLLDAILERVVDTIHEVYSEPNRVYGMRVFSLARAARPCPEPFLLVLHYCQSGVEQQGWQEAVADAIAPYTLRAWCRPAPSAPAGADERAAYASRLNVGWIVETLARWLQDDDGLDEATRLRWWGRMSREYHLGLREAFRLGPPTEVYTVVGEGAEIP
ncbi:MAG: TetR/AcrR family transcriptional regulator [Phenylobacterium sp.]|nr:TetR/AcrR family transcriptional regulator [Phenylobacterium sp.]